MSFNITQSFISGLPRLPYRNGVGAYEGVIAHSTATPNATASAERNYESTHWNDAFVQFFVDWTDIIQTADTNYLCWGAGHTANQRYVQVELCETADANLFKESYARYTWLLAKLLFDRKLGVTHNVTFFTHADTSALFKETDHTDPIQYLASHGVTVDQLIADVTAQYNALVNPPQAHQTSLPPSNSIGLLTVIVQDLYYYNKPDWNAKAGMVHKGEVYTVVQSLVVNGSKMYKLKSGNYITANPNYVSFK